MDWNDLRHFLALARLGWARAAGASLGVSHSTVVRRVEALEVRLSARLFDRNREGYSLTEAGRQMLPGAERVEREMATLERGLVGQDERLEGSVAVTCCDNYVARLLLAHMTPFCELYPDIELNGLDFKIHGVIVQRSIKRKVKRYPHYPNAPAVQDLARPLS